MTTEIIMIMIETGNMMIIYVTIVTTHIMNVGMVIIATKGNGSRTIEKIKEMLSSKTMAGTTKGSPLTTLIILMKMIVSQVQ
jgi:hypothetical protein